MIINTLFGDDIVPSKVCIKCNIDKPLSEFAIRNNRSEYRNDCKSCQKKETKIRNDLKKNNPCPTSADYQCPICNRNSDDLSHLFRSNKTPWVIDHEHSTGKFRGWICNPCNTGLSRFNDNIEVLKRAIEYLK